MHNMHNAPAGAPPTGTPPTGTPPTGTPPTGTPPTGTVTFLFTDIEGSTKRWEAHPQQMKSAIERHDAIVRGAIEANGGIVFRTEGDAFRAAFDTALPAILAAIQAQRSLETEPWPQEIAPLRVRMALHTGAIEARDGDYVGPSLNRMARLLAVANGGQTLLSLRRAVVRPIMCTPTQLSNWCATIYRQVSPSEIWESTASRTCSVPSTSFNW